MIDPILDYALYSFCSSCNSGRISLGASTNLTWSFLGPPRRAMRALRAIMDQNPSQIEPNPTKIEPNPNQSKSKSSPKADPNPNPNQIQIKSKSEPIQIKIKIQIKDQNLIQKSNRKSFRII